MDLVWHYISKMRKILLIILLAAICIAAFAQVPDWYDAALRTQFYPTDVYFSGFAVNEVAKGEDLDKALESIKAAARVEAVSTIQIHVQSVKQDYSRSEDYTNSKKDMAEFYQRFESMAKLSTDIDIPGLKIESYRDGNVVAAFAYVKKRDLQRQLEKQITMGLTRMETQLDNTDELISKGEKAEARSRIADLGKDFAAIERNQELLLAVDPKADAESLQLKELKDLKLRHTQMMTALKNGIYIALQCEADCFGSPFPTLQNELKGNLSDIGCSFTDNPDEADWLIVISAKAREHRAEKYGNYTSYFVYVDSHIAITKQATKQKVYEDEISVKGGDTLNNTNAAHVAYKDTTTKLTAIIKEQIQ